MHTMVTQHNTLNVKMFNLLLKKNQKSGAANDATVTLNVSPNVIEDSNDGTYFPHKYY